MNPIRPIWLYGFLIAMAGFSLFFSARIFGLSDLFLYYPAQGETEANKNIYRVFFVFLPIFQLAGLCAANFLSWFFKSRLSPKAYYAPVFLTLLISVIFIANLNSFLAEKSYYKFFLFASIVLLAYEWILLGIQFMLKKAINPTKAVSVL